MFRRGSLVLAAALAMIGAAVPGMSQPAPQVTANAPRRTKRGLFNGLPLPASSTKWYGARGAGINMAQQQRAVRKARNVRRHKSHVRGVK